MASLTSWVPTVSSAQTTSAGGGATAARGVVVAPPPQEDDDPPLPKPSEPFLTMHRRPKKVSPLSLRKKDKPEDTGKSPRSEITTPRSAREQVAEEGRASRWSADSVLSTRYPLQPSSGSATSGLGIMRPPRARLFSQTRSDGSPSLSGTPLLKRKPKRQLLDRCVFVSFSTTGFASGCCLTSELLLLLNLLCRFVITVRVRMMTLPTGCYPNRQ